METALRLLLSVVLLAAAGSKLARRGALPDALGRLGAGAAARPLAVATTSAEAALGLWLASGRAPFAALVATSALLGAFALALSAVRLGGTRRLACACFGRTRERPTWLLAARAALLAAVAALAAWSPPAPPAVALLAAAVAVLALAVAALAVLLLALYRQVGVLTLRVSPRTALELADEGPPLGTPAPPLAGLERRGSELVAFLSASCRICRVLEPSLAALSRSGTPVRIVHDIDDGAAVERWNVPGAPFVAYVVDGVIAAKGLVNTLEELEGLIAMGTSRAAHASA